ncbi:MAG: hypothetical protein CMF69_05355 [Magnetovibrio sp.]|nr:hypothetical protein [Magnetovibrio sp.]
MTQANTALECQAKDTGEVLSASLNAGERTIVVCKCESGNAKEPVITMDPVTIRDRFMALVQA